MHWWEAATTTNHKHGGGGTLGKQILGDLQGRRRYEKSIITKHCLFIAVAGTLYSPTVRIWAGSVLALCCEMSSLNWWRKPTYTVFSSDCRNLIHWIWYTIPPLELFSHIVTKNISMWSLTTLYISCNCLRHFPNSQNIMCSATCNEKWPTFVLQI